MVESHFLKNNKFIAGDEISIADLLFLTEITNYWKMGYNLYEEKPLMTQWVEECKRILQPHFDTVYEHDFKAIASKTFFATMDFY